MIKTEDEIVYVLLDHVPGVIRTSHEARAQYGWILRDGRWEKGDIADLLFKGGVVRDLSLLGDLPPVPEWPLGVGPNRAS